MWAASFDSPPRPRPGKIYKFLGVAVGGTTERSRYPPPLMNIEGDYERDYQAALS